MAVLLIIVGLLAVAWIAHVTARKFGAMSQAIDAVEQERNALQKAVERLEREAEAARTAKER